MLLQVLVAGSVLGLWLPLPAPQSTCKIARHPPLTLLYARGADSGDPVDEDRVYALIEEREGLRKSRDYAAADDVRDELSGATMGRINTVTTGGSLWVLATAGAAATDAAAW